MDKFTKQFVNIASKLEAGYAATLARWDDSPFKWVLSLPSRTKGAIGEKLIQEFFRDNGFEVLRPVKGTDHDRVINGHRVEIKMSTLWSDGDQYVFQQIRNQEYDVCLCVGISPSKIHCWLIPKEQLVTDKEGFGPQHGGSKGKDTKWLHIDPDQPQKWLAPFGSSLHDCVVSMNALGAGKFKGKALKKTDLL